MDILIIVLALFMGLVAVFGGMASFSGKHKQEIALLKAKNQKLEVQNTDLKKQVEAFQQRESLLRRRLSETEDSTPASFTVPGSVEMEKPQRKVKAVGVVDVMLKRKMITPEQVAKAEKYKQESGSDYPLEEILKLLDYATPQVVESARRMVEAANQPNQQEA